jgi:hypothetical protein
MAGTPLSTRIPEVFNPAAPVEGGAGVYAWTKDSGGNLVPSGLTGLTSGQAWEYSGADLVPTGDPITDDPHWQYSGSDLVPKV